MQTWCGRIGSGVYGFLLPLALLALLVALAWLQYRWTGALSRAEEERLRSGLSSSLARFEGELDFELARVLRAFSMRSSSELPDALAEFRREAHYPEIVANLYRIGFDEGRFDFEKLEENGAFAKADPPPELLRLLERAEGPRNPHRGRPRGPGPPLALISSDPVSVVIPGRFDPRDREPEATLVVLRNDVIAERLLPDIAARVFGSEESLEFDVVVVDEANRVLYSVARQRSRSDSLRGRLVETALAESGYRTAAGPAPRPRTRSRWSASTSTARSRRRTLVRFRSASDGLARRGRGTGTVPESRSRLRRPPPSRDEHRPHDDLRAGGRRSSASERWSSSRESRTSCARPSR